MVALGVLAGLGAGAVDAGLNTHAATRHGPRALLWLHACYGVGAASGPMLIAEVLGAGRSWRAAYAVAAAAQGLLAVCFVASRRSFGAARASAPRSAAPARATLRRPAAWLGMAAFFAYVALEASAGAWLFSVLREDRGASMTAASASASAYWVSLAGGRILFGALVGRVAATALVRSSIAGVAAGSALLAAGLGGRSDAAAVVLLGLSAGPIFPCLVAATPGRLGPSHAPNAVGFQVAAAALGQSLVPAGAGILAARVGLDAVPLALVGLSAVLFALHEGLLRNDRRGLRDRAAATGIGAACRSDEPSPL
jgi:fucose permease